MRPKQKQRNEILPFATTYNPANPNLKKILMKHWQLIQGQPNLSRIFKQLTIVSYKKERSLKDILVRAKNSFIHTTIIIADFT